MLVESDYEADWRMGNARRKVVVRIRGNPPIEKIECNLITGLL